MMGDINLLNVEEAIEPFGRVADSLSAADLVISNLECVLDTPKKVHSIAQEEFFLQILLLVLTPHPTVESLLSELPTTSTMVPIISWDQLLLSTRQALLILVWART